MKTRLLVIFTLFVMVFSMANSDVSGFVNNKINSVNDDTTKVKLAPDNHPTLKGSAITEGNADAKTDTTMMDSLQLAIYHHNKMVDDSIRLDSLNKKKKSGIDAPVKYEAQDSLVYEAKSNTAHLYGAAEVSYENMNLKSDKIYMSLDSSLVHATGSADSTQKAGIKGRPVFTMGQDKYDTDTMAFNFKSKKGIVRNAYTQQEDGYLVSKVSKRNDKGELFLAHGLSLIHI